MDMIEENEEKMIRRNDIILAAEKVFFKKGYLNATMDDVTKEAGFSKRTIYKYFNSKEQLYFEIMIKGYKLLIDMIQLEIETFDTVNSLEKIKLIGKTLFKFSNTYSDYFNAIIEYENGEMDFRDNILDKSKEECYELGEKILSYLRNFIEDGIKEKLINPELDVVVVTLVLWASTVGIFTTLKRKCLYIKSYHNKNNEELVEQSFELLIGSIKK